MQFNISDTLFSNSQSWITKQVGITGINPDTVVIFPVDLLKK